MAGTGAHFIHCLNPVIVELWGIKLWYYGLAYTLGFLGVHLWLRWRQKELGWHTEEIYDFSILFAACVLIFGRAFSVGVYHWEYYRDHLSQLLNYWGGGMASHGVLLGGVVGVWLFSRLRRKSFLQVTDGIVIPVAFLLGLGRIGNFINGQICGRLSDVWWAVKFPGLEGFRHPVTLYEAIKNFLLLPILLQVRRKSYPGQGKLLAHFIFWYGLMRLFTDCFREYGGSFLGIGGGQYFNLLMAGVGLTLMVRFSKGGQRPVAGGIEKRSRPPHSQEKQIVGVRQHGWRSGIYIKYTKRVVFIFLLVFSLTIPSGVDKQAYGARKAQGGIWGCNLAGKIEYPVFPSGLYAEEKTFEERYD